MFNSDALRGMIWLPCMKVAHVHLWDWTSAAKTIQSKQVWQQQLSMSACAYLYTDILTVRSA